MLPRPTNELTELLFCFHSQTIDFCSGEAYEEFSLCYKQIWLAGLYFVQLVSDLQMKDVNYV